MSALIEKIRKGDIEAIDLAANLQESIIGFCLDEPTTLGQIKSLIAEGYEVTFTFSKPAGSEGDISGENTHKLTDRNRGLSIVPN